MPSCTSFSEKDYKRLGTALTAMSMVPQGIFGTLLVDTAWAKDQGMPTRIMVDAFILVTAFEGKRRIVQYFNQNAFGSLAGIDWRSTIGEFLTPKNWTLPGALNTVFTINASLLFAFLANVSFNGAAKLLRTLDQPKANAAANIFDHPACQYPFFTASLVANLLSFPGIHRGAVAYIKDVCESLLTSYAYKQRLHNKRKEIYKVKVSYQKKCAEDIYCQNNNDGMISSEGHLKGLLKDWQVITSDPEANDDSAINYEQALTAINQMTSRDFIQGVLSGSFFSSDYGESTFRSCCESLFAFSLNIVFDSVCLAGFYNFKNLWKVVINTCLSDFADSVPEALPNIIGWMVYASMMAMVFCSIPQLVGVISDGVFSNSHALGRVSSSRNACYYALAFSICALGGTPNAYQAWELDNESLFWVVMAAVAPLLLEVFAFRELLVKNHISNDRRPVRKLLDAIDDKFNQAASSDLVSDDVEKYHFCARFAFSQCLESNHDVTDDLQAVFRYVVLR